MWSLLNGSRWRVKQLVWFCVRKQRSQSIQTIVQVSVHPVSERRLARKYLFTFILGYLAQYNGSGGTLFLSKAGVRFAPFLGGKKSKSGETGIIASVDPATGVEYPTGGDDENDGEIVPLEGEEPGIVVEGNEVEIPMMEIAGLRKVQRSKLGVTISSGLEIDTIGEQVSRSVRLESWCSADDCFLAQKFTFPFVANRDQVSSSPMLVENHR